MTAVEISINMSETKNTIADSETTENTSTEHIDTTKSINMDTDTAANTTADVTSDTNDNVVTEIAKPDVKQEVSKWFDPTIVPTIKKHLDKIKQLKIKVEYPFQILTIGLVDILGSLGWYSTTAETSYQNFNNTIKDILDYKNNNNYFHSLVLDKKTLKKTFWIIRVYVHLKNSESYKFDEQTYNKKDVLLSKAFYDHITEYLVCQLKNEVSLHIFTAAKNSTHKSFLSFGKVPLTEQKYLENTYGNLNPKEYIMFMFKKFIPRSQQ